MVEEPGKKKNKGSVRSSKYDKPFLTKQGSKKMSDLSV